MKLSLLRVSPGARRSALALVLLSACTRTIYDVVGAADVTINGPTGDLEPGQVVQLTAQVLSADGTVLPERTISWSTSAEAVAAVDASGRVTGRTPGAVMITASSEGRSAQRSFTVRSALPTITSVSPTTALPNAAFDLTVQGTGFYNGSVVRWNGANRPTTFVSGTELRAAIPATDAAVPGAVPITVLNQPPGGGTSNAVSLTVQPADPCQQVHAYTIGESVIGALETGDCQLSNGSYSDIFLLAVGTAEALTFRMTSMDVDPFLILMNSAGSKVYALNDDAAGLDSGLTMLIAAGSYRLYATTAFEGEVGAYTVASNRGPTSVSGCAEYWIMPGVQTTQDITTSDCATPAGEDFWYSDRYKIYLAAGQTVRIGMSSTAVDAYLLLLDGETLDELAQDDDSGGNGNADLTFIAPADGIYIIDASTFSSGETGAYTLVLP